MFTDVQVPLPEIGKTIPTLSTAGLNSVAKYLGFPAGVIKALSKKNLMDAVLVEIQRRNEGDLCPLRRYDNTPIGVPSGMDADNLNHFLASKFFSLSDLEAPYTMSVYQKKNAEDIELLPNDVFKINYSGWADTLSGKVEQRVELLRLVCTNRAMVTEKAFTRKCNLSAFDPEFGFFEASREAFIPTIQSFLKRMNASKGTVETLKTLASVATEISSDKLKNAVKDKAETVLYLYEIPPSMRDKEEDKLNPLSFPQTWRQTALLEDSVYDCWNMATKEITTLENLKVLPPERALKAHILASSLLRFKTPEEVVIAQRRKKSN